MDEKATNPVQAAPAQAIPAAVPADSDKSRKGSPLLVFLTVLLILVGIADVILWGIVGYYFLRDFQNRDAEGEGVQISEEEPARAETAPSEPAEEPDALDIYVQDMLELEIWSRHDAVKDRYNELRYTDGSTAEEYTELAEQIIPAFQQVFEDAQKIASDDPEVRELHKQFLEYGTKRLSACEMRASGIGNNEYDEVVGADDLTEEANNMVDAYVRTIETMARERGIALSFDR